jgi:hypothetical protein
MIQEWEYSAKILIYHYRVVLKGMIPFAVPWDKKHQRHLRHEANLDDEAMAYIRTLKGKIQERGKSDFIHSSCLFRFMLSPRFAPYAKICKTTGRELHRASEEDISNKAAKPLVWISRLYIDGEI